MHAHTHMHVEHAKHAKHGCLYAGGHLQFLYMCVCVHACVCMCMHVGTPPMLQMPLDTPHPSAPPQTHREPKKPNFNNY